MLDVTVELEGGLRPGCLVALTNFDFAPVFECLVGVLKVRFGLGTLCESQFLKSCCLVDNELHECWSYPGARRMGGEAAGFGSRGKDGGFEGGPQFFRVRGVGRESEKTNGRCEFCGDSEIEKA